MDKHCDVFTKCNTIQLKKKKKTHTNAQYMDESQKHYVKGKKPNIKERILYIIYIYLNTI